MKDDDYGRVKGLCSRSSGMAMRLSLRDVDWLKALDNRRNLQGANFAMSPGERERFESIEEKMS